MDREYLKRDEALTGSSEAVTHERTPQNRLASERPISGYAPEGAEKEARGEPREMFAMTNSYNSLSVGADKKGDLTIAGSAVRRHNSPTLANDAKRVEASRKKKHHGSGGEFFTNPARPEESAFAYRVNRRMPEKKILRKLREHERRHHLARMNDTLPFLDVRENEQQLAEMRREEAPEHEKQALEKIIRDKKTQEMKFLRNLKISRGKLNALDPEELRRALRLSEAELMQKHLPAAENSGDDGDNPDEPEDTPDPDQT